ncbi:hypothetical protein COBT_003974, partial [Conglomerata obtusa]
MFFENCVDAKPGGKPPGMKSFIGIGEAEKASLMSKQDGTELTSVQSPSKACLREHATSPLLPSSSWKESEKWIVKNLMHSQVKRQNKDTWPRTIPGFYSAQEI